MNKITRVSLKFLIFLLSLSPVFAVSVQDDKPVSLKAETNIVNQSTVFKDNFIKAKYASAENKFIQGNIKATYDDFSSIVSSVSHDDYVLLTYAIKMAEYGFFDLSEELFNKLDSNLYTENYIKDIKNFYYPSGMANFKDNIYFADAYAGIVYNNLAIETTSELLNTPTVDESDYKNYLIALGYYKSNNLPQALKYINNAIIQNNNNVNYKVLKTKILADSQKSKQALRVLNEIKKVEFFTVDFQDKIRCIEEYVLYKLSKEEPLKDYHLSYYYHLQEKSLLATKVLQASILQAKNYSSKIFGLLSRIYYENDESLIAQEFAERAYKEDAKNYMALLTLADLCYEERKYEDALGYYLKAKKVGKKESAPIVGIANSYMALDKSKKSKKLYEKMLKKDFLNEELLVSSLKVFPQRADEHLPLVVSIDITNNEVWLALAYKAIKDKNYAMAETYLKNSYYIDENNFKYYYYLSLVLKARGEIEKAKQSLVKCSRLNSEYVSIVNPE